MRTRSKKQSLGSRIKAAREKANLSQSEAAAEWGINLRTLQGWEIDRRKPRGLALVALESILERIERE